MFTCEAHHHHLVMGVIIIILVASLTAGSISIYHITQEKYINIVFLVITLFIDSYIIYELKQMCDGIKKYGAENIVHEFNFCPKKLSDCYKKNCVWKEDSEDNIDELDEVIFN